MNETLLGWRKFAIVGLGMVVLGGLVALKIDQSTVTMVAEWVTGLAGIYCGANLVERKMANTANKPAEPPKPTT